jgi:hypothetical protein
MASSGYLKTLKEPLGFMTGTTNFSGRLFDFFKRIENCGYIASLPDFSNF